MRIPIDGSMLNECRIFDVGTVFKKKTSNGLALVSSTFNIGVDLVFATEDDFSAWGKAVLEAQEMMQLIPINKETRLKQARDKLKNEYSRYGEGSQETSSKFTQSMPLVEKIIDRTFSLYYANCK